MIKPTMENPIFAFGVKIVEVSPGGMDTIQELKDFAKDGVKDRPCSITNNLFHELTERKQK